MQAVEHRLAGFRRCQLAGRGRLGSSRPAPRLGEEADLGAAARFAIEGAARGGRVVALEEEGRALGDGEEAGGVALDLDEACQPLQIGAKPLGDLAGGVELKREARRGRLLPGRVVVLCAGRCVCGGRGAG